MQTNKTINKESELQTKAAALMQAAHDYWEEYQKECGSAAVVWLENDNGHFILFTRSEYKSDIMHFVPHLQSEAGMVHPFEANAHADGRASRTVGREVGTGGTQ